MRESVVIFRSQKGFVSKEVCGTAVMETYFVLVRPEEISVLKISLFRIVTPCSLVVEHTGFFIMIEDVGSMFSREARIFVPDYTVSHCSSVLSTYSLWFKNI